MLARRERPSVKSGLALLMEIDRRIVDRFPFHPFETLIHKENFAHVAPEYLAMSIAFPYIQAGAIYENYRRTSALTSDTNRNVEITAAIGSFLAWDEFGGHELTRTRGNEGLPFLTRVDQNFHSNLLRRDFQKLLGRKMKPRFSATTATYLNLLFSGLSDGQGNRNVAHMIAFEKHAATMITALWGAICRIFDLPKDERLKYFYLHVGGDSPAEAFHMEMTRKMVSTLVTEGAHKQFVHTCIEAYAANIQWCEDILSIDPPPAIYRSSKDSRCRALL